MTLTGDPTAVVPTRPFRGPPHQSMADVWLLGRGQVPTPGEVSLADNGTLCVNTWQACLCHEGVRSPGSPLGPPGPPRLGATGAEATP
jgi:Magnesium chelatase, subunit ChlI